VFMPNWSEKPYPPPPNLLEIDNLPLRNNVIFADHC
jgi:hypothetical protein